MADQPEVNSLSQQKRQHVHRTGSMAGFTPEPLGATLEQQVAERLGWRIDGRILVSRSGNGQWKSCAHFADAAQIFWDALLDAEKHVLAITQERDEAVRHLAEETKAQR